MCVFQVNKSSMCKKQNLEIEASKMSRAAMSAQWILGNICLCASLHYSNSVIMNYISNCKN